MQTSREEATVTAVKVNNYPNCWAPDVGWYYRQWEVD